MDIDVPKGFALQALYPGSFVFMKPVGENDYYNTPISVMEANHDEGTISVVIKVVSSKTKKIAAAEDYIEIRGVYRNGLIGGGARQLVQDKKNGAKWLIIAKGIALAPAVKLMNWAGDNIDVDLIIDPDKINDEIIRDFLVVPAMQISFLTDLELFDEEMTSGYDRVIILTSNYFIKTIKTQLKIPDVKLVYCNNFNMCCGEGICGACVYTDENGNSYKTCKCNLNG
jgi:NAD(P)H-flavin reductase